MPTLEPEIVERASSTASKQGAYVSLGITDAEGWEYYKADPSGNLPPPPPTFGNGNGGGGGDMTPLWKLDIPRDVQIAKWGLGALLGLVGLFYWASYLPDTKEVRRDIGNLNTNVAVQTKAIGGIEDSLSRIEGQLDKQSATMGSAPAPTKSDDAGRKP